MIWPERVISCLIWILLYFTLFVTKAWSKIIFKNQKSSQSIWDSYQPTSTSPRRSHQDIHTQQNQMLLKTSFNREMFIIWSDRQATGKPKQHGVNALTREPGSRATEILFILRNDPPSFTRHHFLERFSLLQLLVFASHWTRCNWQHTLVKALQPALAKLNIANTKLTLTSINLDFCKSSRG